MTIDPLCFLLMVEAIFLLSGGLCYMTYRHWQKDEFLQKPDVFDRSRLAGMLEKAIAEAEKSQKAFQQGTEEFSTFLAEKVAGLNLDLTMKVLEGVLSEDTNPLDRLTTWMSDGFQKTATKRLDGIEEYFEQKNREVRKKEDAEPADPCGDMEKERPEGVPMDAPGKGVERVFVREGTSAHSAFKKMRDQFDTVVDFNNELRERLAKLREEKAGSKEYAQLLSQNIEHVERVVQELEQSNRELNLCVSTLESANDDLTNRIEELLNKEKSHGETEAGRDTASIEALEKETVQRHPEEDDLEEESTNLASDVGEREQGPGNEPEGETTHEEQGEPEVCDVEDGTEPVSDEDLEELKRSLDCVEGEYMDLYQELSPLRDPARAKPIEELDPQTQKKVAELEGKLAEKERKISEIQRRIDELESQEERTGHTGEKGEPNGAESAKAVNS